MLSQSRWIRGLISFFIVMGIVLGTPGEPGLAARAGKAILPQGDSGGPIVSVAVQHDVSPALAGQEQAAAQAQELSEQALESEQDIDSPPRLTFPKAENAQPPSEPDGALQNAPSAGGMPMADFNFEGVKNADNPGPVLPPDTNGDIGPNHYVQWVNLSMQIWRIDREQNTAVSVYGPRPGNAIWAGFGGACQNSNHGDPIVLYDHLADRWLISQFALPNGTAGPFYQCLAVSTSPDPTGTWHRYAFLMSLTKMNDYPHLGIWPDGYYMTINQFSDNGNTWAGVGAFVFERDKMLLGQPARMIGFDLLAANEESRDYGGMLPADLDGPPPPAGTPNYFGEVDDSSFLGPRDAFRIWEFHVDWANPANSTFGANPQRFPNAVLPVANFNLIGKGSIPQPGTAIRLDSVGDRLMHRLQYRYFGSHATLVTNHTVDVDPNLSDSVYQGAVRWYQLRNAGGGWSLQQQGTYAGDAPNGESRWMGSAAMDSSGNIAVGYSASSSAVYPSIRYTGRLASDPAGQLPQGEITLVAGGGSQTHSGARWGDYTAMSVDPADDCTFWYTNEYLAATSSSGWRTRIGSFIFPSCLAGAKGGLRGRVTDSISGEAIPGAHVQANEFDTFTGDDGAYEFKELPVGDYSVSVSAYGYQPGSPVSVTVTTNNTSTRDFSLVKIPRVTVSGVVKDGSGQGWPLYARIDIAATDFARTIYTDPATGAYSIELAHGIEHTFAVTAVSPGYATAGRQVTPPPMSSSQNFTLTVQNTNPCPPGYTFTDTCQAQVGGLLVGRVLDANTGEAVNGAQVASLDSPEEKALTMPTPDDEAQGDGLYILFATPGGETFEASSDRYASDRRNATIVQGGVVKQDFALKAGRLAAEPPNLSITVEPPGVITRTITLRNTGTLTASFTLSEVDAPFPALAPTGPFARVSRSVSPKRLNDLDASAVYAYNPPLAAALPGGQVLRSWPSGLAHPWGLALDTASGEVWVGSLSAENVDEAVYGFLPDGSSTGRRIDLAGQSPSLSMDMAYNPFTGALWQVRIGEGSCIAGLDPAGQRATVEQICPPFDQSQRGLVFNPLDGTFYSGSWTNGIIYHFDSAGQVLDSANTGLNIAGLAFNPATGHLFVLSNASQGFDVYVLEPASGYKLLGGFDIDGLGDFQQAGMDLACDGSLWVVNQATGEVLEVDSGEGPACVWADVPWLQAAPLSGSIPPGGSRSILLNLDTDLLDLGRNPAQLVAGNDTPYGPLTIPVDLLNPVHVFLPAVPRR